MLQWLKDILKDGYTDTIDASVSTQIGKDFVARTDFNALNETKKTLEAQVGDRDKQIEGLKKVDPEKLQAEITRLTGENKAAANKYDTDVKAIKLNAALETRLVKEGAVNTKAVRALLDTGKISLDGENLVGIDDQLSKLKESEKWAFTGAAAAAPGTPATPPTPGATGLHQQTPPATLDGVESAFYKLNPDLAPKA